MHIHLMCLLTRSLVRWIEGMGHTAWVQRVSKWKTDLYQIYVFVSLLICCWIEQGLLKEKIPASLLSSTLPFFFSFWIILDSNKNMFCPVKYLVSSMQQSTNDDIATYFQLKSWHWNVCSFWNQPVRNDRKEDIAGAIKIVLTWIDTYLFQIIPYKSVAHCSNLAFI